MHSGKGKASSSDCRHYQGYLPAKRTTWIFSLRGYLAPTSDQTGKKGKEVVTPLRITYISAASVRENGPSNSSFNSRSEI